MVGGTLMCCFRHIASETPSFRHLRPLLHVSTVFDTCSNFHLLGIVWMISHELLVVLYNCCWSWHSFIKLARLSRCYPVCNVELVPFRLHTIRVHVKMLTHSISPARGTRAWASLYMLKHKFFLLLFIFDDSACCMRVHTDSVCRRTIITRRWIVHRWNGTKP